MRMSMHLPGSSLQIYDWVNLEWKATSWQSFFLADLAIHQSGFMTLPVLTALAKRCIKIMKALA